MGVFSFCTIVCLLATFAATWDTFACHRTLSLPTQGQCTLTHSNWISQHQRSWQLDQIQGVHLEAEGFQKNGSPRYRLDLRTTTGIVKLPFADSIPNLLPNMAEEIQQFLGDPQRSSVQEQQDQRPYSFFRVAACLAFAGLFGVLGQRVTLEISKYSQRLTLRRRNLLGTQTLEYPLDQIADVIVLKNRGGKLGPMGRIAIVLKNGNQIDVHSYDQYYTAGSAHECATRILHFLDL